MTNFGFLELPKKAPVSSGDRTTREDEKWKTAGGRMALVQTWHSYCCSRTSFPLAETYRYLHYDSLFKVTNFEFSRDAHRRWQVC